MKKKYIFSIAFILLLIISAMVLLIVLLGNEEVVVNTNSGMVRGLNIDSDISNFYAFYRIPYALPPINNLRFQLPVPIGSWDSAHDGAIEGPACPQWGYDDISEDCLTMSVYTNDLSASDRPVLVWLHGGALENGHVKIATHGPHYFMKHDVIVVTVQFRLNIFGFLNMNLETAPGNMGLADAIEALVWVKNNIEYFGGDPNQITVGGLSSGAIMAHALSLSPQAHNLFQRVISQSGTALSYRFYHEDLESSIAKTKLIIGMNDSSNQEVLDYLKTLPTSDLMNITLSIKIQYPAGYAQYYPYAITKDFNNIIPKDPIEILIDNDYEPIPMLIGFNSDEGIRLETSIHLLDFVNSNFFMVVPTDLFPIDDLSLEKNETADIIKNFYFGEEQLSFDTFRTLADLCRDSWYAHITDYVIRLQGYQGHTQPIYYYMFAVDGAYNLEKVKNNITSPGANHGDDMGYLWRRDELASIEPNDDFSDLSRERLVAMWSNFVRIGNPTPEINDLTPIKWEQVEYPAMKYLLINRTLTMQEEPLRESLLFWQRLYGWTEL